MGDRFDELAKAMAKGMPRRRVLRLLAGGLTAAVGTSMAGMSAIAGNRQGTMWPQKRHHIGVNQTFPKPPAVNQTFPRPPIVNQTYPQPPVVNQTFPKRPMVNQIFPKWPLGW